MGIITPHWDHNGNAKGPLSPGPTRTRWTGEDGPDIDHDGDSLADIQEYAAWASFSTNKLPLAYSGGGSG